MRISYRTTSIVVLVVLPLAVAFSLLPLPQQRPLTSTKEGLLGWDPCSLWEQMDPMVKAVTVVWLAALVVLVIRGLRNRPGQRWAGIAGLLATILTITANHWRIAAGCYTASNLISWFAWSGAVCLLFLHHALRPRPRLEKTNTSEPRNSSSADVPRPRSLSCFARSFDRASVPSLAFMIIAGSALVQLRALAYQGRPRQASLAFVTTNALRSCVGWAILALILLMCARWIYRLARQLSARSGSAETA